MLLAVAAWLGNPVLAMVFYILLAIQIIVHALWICPRCGNYGCAINLKSPHFFLGVRKPGEPSEERAAINTPPFFLLLVVLLVVMLMIAFYAVFQVSPAVTVIMALSGIILFYIYSQDACRGCPNECPMAGNRKPA